ncbi:gluconokinase [Bacillus sp. 2205SS5-2]|uniref:gluconokinase n=1 Tax=Bacillus sp. 2205SS5-2 TaxID=3109031 RepID=UPI003005DA66
MKKHYILGLDIGTTSAKAIIFDRNGNVHTEHEIPYPLSHPQPGWVEQDPDEIEQAAKRAIKIVLSKSNLANGTLIGVGISAAMHSLILLDANHTPLTPSIIWADGRSVEQANKMKNTEGLSIYLKTGTPIHPMSPFIKLLWMKETKYEPYQKAAKIISIKEYILLKWFGKMVVDYSIASATGLFNIHKLMWEPSALALAGISEEQLSKPVPPTEIFQGMKENIALEMGIPLDLPFVIGGSDGPLANLGIGAIDESDVAITIGTSGAIRKMTSRPQTDSNQDIFCYAFSQDLWVMGGPTNNGGIVFRWLKTVLGEKETDLALRQEKDVYELLSELAAKAKPGSNDLLFLPYLNGERAPHWDAFARGSYIGLTESHQKPHLIRAGLEGVIYNIYTISETLERLGGPSQTLLASGGFARSPLWLQILADIFGKEVKVPRSHQSSAWGACWTALYALNEVNSFYQIKRSIPMDQSFLPNDRNHKVYQDLYPIYKDLYAVLKPQFQRLADLQSERVSS